MSDNTGIQWTDATWNPIRGCSRVSPGCTNCYAETVAARFSGPGLPYEGLARRRSNGEPQWTGVVRVIEDHVLDPIRWKRPRRIFVNSMSDLFHEKLPAADIARIFAVMALAPRHTFQVLTKRPARMLAYMQDATLTTDTKGRLLAGTPERIAAAMYDIAKDAPDVEWPLPNVWLGVSVEHQAAADERIPLLVQTPAAVRFLSCEPLLGPLDLRAKCPPYHAPHLRTDRISWVIVGGESGKNARPFDLAWARSIVTQCRETGVAPFVKQLGARPCECLIHGEQGQMSIHLRDSHGGDMSEWSEDLRVREFPDA